MSILEAITAVRAITAAFRAKDWITAMQLTAAFIAKLLSDGKPLMASATPEQSFDLKSALAEMNECCCAA